MSFFSNMWIWCKFRYLEYFSSPSDKKKVNNLVTLHNSAHATKLYNKL